jgi:hypothetical protein
MSPISARCAARNTSPPPTAPMPLTVPKPEDPRVTVAGLWFIEVERTRLWRIVCRGITSVQDRRMEHGKESVIRPACGELTSDSLLSATLLRAASRGSLLGRRRDGSPAFWRACHLPLQTARFGIPPGHDPRKPGRRRVRRSCCQQITTLTGRVADGPVCVRTNIRETAPRTTKPGGRAKAPLRLPERKRPQELPVWGPTVAIRCAESGDRSRRRCPTHRGWSDGRNAYVGATRRTLRPPGNLAQGSTFYGPRVLRTKGP